MLVKVLVEPSILLLVKVWVWFRNAKVSLALSAGMVATLDDVGATLVIVVVLVDPKTIWLVVGVTFSAPLSVNPAKVGVLEVAIDCGRDNVIAPVAPETLT